MVATKIARRCQALGWTPPGGGIDQITIPTTSTPRKRSASSQPEIVAACLPFADSVAGGAEAFGGFIALSFLVKSRRTYFPFIVLHLTWVGPHGSATLHRRGGTNPHFL